MLEIRSDNGEVEYEVEGTPIGIMSDLLCAINVLNEHFEVNGNGEFFREFLKTCVDDGSAFSEDGYPVDEKEH